MLNSVLIGFRGENGGEDSLRGMGVRDRNSSDVPKKRKEFIGNISGRSSDLFGMSMVKQRKVGGRAAQALKELRESVINYPKEPTLTYAQMALECGFIDENGEGIASTYQYNEREYEKDYFSKEKVDRFKIPLSKRGIPETEIYSVLTGVRITSPGKKSRVNFLPETDGHSIPVLSHQTVLRLTRGEIRLGQVSRISPEARRFKAAGVIMGWVDIPETNEDTVVMEWDNDRGSWLIIDRSCKTFEEGESYVCLIGDVLRYGTVLNGKFYSDEGDDFGEVIDFGDNVPVIFGLVLWLMERKALRRTRD